MPSLKRLPPFFAFALGVVVTDTARIALADDVDQISDEVVDSANCTEHLPPAAAAAAMTFRHSMACCEVIP